MHNVEYTRALEIAIMVEGVVANYAKRSTLDVCLDRYPFLWRTVSFVEQGGSQD